MNTFNMLKKYMKNGLEQVSFKVILRYQKKYQERNCDRKRETTQLESIGSFNYSIRINRQQTPK
jgi:hypothetical protein